jgi:hypothetical protein
MGAEGPLYGDFRDWDRIRAWASDVARQLDSASAGKQQIMTPERLIPHRITGRVLQHGPSEKPTQLTTGCVKSTRRKGL